MWLYLWASSLTFTDIATIKDNNKKFANWTEFFYAFSNLTKIQIYAHKFFCASINLPWSHLRSQIWANSVELSLGVTILFILHSIKKDSLLETQNIQCIWMSWNKFKSKMIVASAQLIQFKFKPIFEYFKPLVVCVGGGGEVSMTLKNIKLQQDFWFSFVKFTINTS